MSNSLNSSIQGKILEVKVVGCDRLRDTEWFSRQDPYIEVYYGTTKYRTKTCTDGGRTPVFQDEFKFTLIEGITELNLIVWNDNTFSADNFIAEGKVSLEKVLSHGFDNSNWPLQTKNGRSAGIARMTLHYPNAIRPTSSFQPAAAPPPSVPPHQVPQYSAPPQPPPPQYAPQYPPYSYQPPPPAYAQHPPPSPAYAQQPPLSQASYFYNSGSFRGPFPSPY